MSASLDTWKRRAEIAKLNAETVKLHAEMVRLRTAEHELDADGHRLSREVFWYPVAISTALIGTVAGITLVLSRLIG